MGTFKKIIGFVAVSAGAYCGFKFYQRIRSSIALSNNLPTYLNNIYGEKPKLRLNMGWKNLTIKVTFSEEIVNKNDDIEAQIKEYIEDFHEPFKNVNLDIEVLVSEKDLKESDEDASEEQTEETEEVTEEDNKETSDEE